MTTDTSPTVHRDVEFHQTPERTLRLDVYEPTAASAGENGPWPTIVLFHGGGFHSGEKSQDSDQTEALADRGYVVVTPEYRRSGEATFPAALIDAKAAVEWCRAEGEAYGIDPRRIATAGHSAGANLATLVSVTADEPGFEPDAYPGVSSAVQAAVGWAGLYDFRSFDAEPEFVVDYLGGTREEVPAAYDFASPMGQTDAQTAPTLVVHGDADEVLPIEQARRYADSVDALATAEFVAVGDCGHTFPPDAIEPKVEETDRFLSAHLAGGRRDLDPHRENDRHREAGDGFGQSPGPIGDLDGPPAGDRFDR